MSRQSASSQPVDQARLWRTEAFGGLELLRARFGEFTFAPHAHEEYFIAITEGGQASPHFWGEAQRLGPGDMFVLRPGEIHSGGPVKGSVWQYRGFYLPVALIQRAAREITGADRGIPQFTKEVFNDPRGMALLRRAHLSMEKPASILERETRLLEALASLVERHGKGIAVALPAGHEHRAVKLAREMLESLPAENISLESLAQAAGLSSYHLCRVFRAETGFSPHAYQLLVRVKLAKALLAARIPISQAALEAGFFDQAHLTRHFKRIFGVTPGQYAK